MKYDHKALERLCQQYGVKKLAFFGSVVRSDFREDSDVDVLVEFHQAKVPGLFEYGLMREDLVVLFGRQVDLITYSSLTNPYRRKQIITDEEIQYEEAG